VESQVLKTEAQETGAMKTETIETLVKIQALMQILAKVLV